MSPHGPDVPDRGEQNKGSKKKKIITICKDFKGGGGGGATWDVRGESKKTLLLLRSYNGPKLKGKHKKGLGIKP